MTRYELQPDSDEGDKRPGPACTTPPARPPKPYGVFQEYQWTPAAGRLAAELVDRDGHIYEGRGWLVIGAPRPKATTPRTSACPSLAATPT